MHLTRIDDDLNVKMKLHSLTIRDELQGRLFTSPCYLACSVLRNENIFSSPLNNSHKKETSLAPYEDDDSFKDALPEFFALPDTEIHSGIDSAVIPEKELGKESATWGEIFYEAECNDSNFVSVTFSTRSPSSSDYDGVDTQVLAYH